MNYQELAKEILRYVGGESNVAMVTHCATRLRFNLKDSGKAETEALKKVQGVLGVVEKGGQFQIVIGNDVPNVFKEINALGNFDSKNTTDQQGKKGGVLNIVFDTIAGIFTPFLPALTGAGMIKAVMAILVAFKVVSPESQMYAILNFVGDAAFYFMPIMLAYSAAQKFKTNPYLAMTLGGILLHPGFTGMVDAAKESGAPIKLLGLSVPLVSYASSVIPIILTVWLMSYVHKFADKISPKVIKFFTVPLITIAITAPIMLIAVGPLGNYIGELVASGISFVDEKAGWLTPLIIGTLSPLLVMGGMHYAIVPFGVNNLATLGYDTMVGPGMLASNIAQGGAVLAVAFKTKNKNFKQLASSAGITAVCGITEPAMYGVSLRLKRPLYAVMLGGGVGGLLAGILGVRRFMSGSPGLLTLPAYIGDPLTNLGFAVLVCAVSFVTAFVATLILGFEDVEDEKKGDVATTKMKVTDTETINAKTMNVETMNAEMINAETVDTAESNTAGKNHPEMIKAPIAGQIIPLTEVDDATFSSEILGKGVGIKAQEGRVVAPAAGTVVTVYGTKHAICLKTDEGAEILLHVGLETVRLEGKYFECKVKEGQRVSCGDELILFDRDNILNEGYDLTTPVIITNSDDYHSIDVVAGSNVKAAEDLMELS